MSINCEWINKTWYTSPHQGKMLTTGKAERVHGDSVFSTQLFCKLEIAQKKKSLFKNVVYQYNEILLSHKKERSTNTCYIDKP